MMATLADLVTIGELARRAGVATSALRYYEQLGLISSQRTAGGQRRYMAVVEDRSAEEERDLAQLQIGAMMDTAGVGLATFQYSRSRASSRGESMT